MTSQAFRDVTIGMLEHIAAGEDAAGFAFQIDDTGRGGSVAGATPLGEVEAQFGLDPDKGELLVTILRKPAILPASLVWAEFAKALARAREVTSATMSHDPQGG